ncbi:MAG: DUF58 domain-containing protein [Candidatus Latescibacteria bacterium]|nr:DUF58 domain-containing protein [Candidatus Latescibacterota bacterium]
MKQFYQDFLSPESVSRLSRLDLIARLVVEGYITGLHKSPYHGFSAEFAEHRQYMAGDSLRYLDWKVYGRTDRMYIKRFEEETNLKSHIILDVSGSMGFQGSGAMTKLRYGSVLAAALAFLMIKQRDSVGLVTFSDKMKSYVPPRSVQSQLKEILKVLSSAEPSGVTITGDILHTLAERIPVRGLVVLISDLIVEPCELIHCLKHFRHNGHEVLVFHVLDPKELNLDYSAETRFTDMETGRQLTTQPWHIRETYLSMMKERLSSLVHQMHDISVDYAKFTTDVPFDRALSEYLAKRKKLY